MLGIGQGRDDIKLIFIMPFFTKRESDPPTIVRLPQDQFSNYEDYGLIYDLNQETALCGHYITKHNKTVYTVESLI